MALQGWRPVTESDIIAGGTAVMVQIHMWKSHSGMKGKVGSSTGTTLITFSDPPVKRFTEDKASVKLVLFHLQGVDDQQEYGIPYNEFLFDTVQYRNLDELNNVRYYARK